MAVKLSEREIPPWMRDVQLPEGEDLLHILEEVRAQPALIFDATSAAVYVDFFRRLAERARSECRDKPGDARAEIAVQLLDMVPGYLEAADPAFDWIRSALTYVFNLRRYAAVFDTLKKRVGAPNSSGPRTATVDQLVANGWPTGKAIEAVAKESGVSADAVERERTRERKARQSRNEKIDASDKRLGIEESGDLVVVRRPLDRPGSAQVAESEPSKKKEPSKS